MDFAQVQLMAELQMATASCASCPCGRAAGVKFGGRCPLVDRRHPRGELLYSEGEVGHTVWFVKRGAVLLSRAGADGRERARVVRRPGDFVGVESVVRATYSDSAQTTEASVLCGIGKDRLDQWLGPSGTPARMVLEQMLLATSSESPRGAGADGTATQRVARWLLGEGESPQVERQVMASLLGMAPETLSRALARLDAEGAIEVTRREVTVRSRERLEAMAW